MTRFRSPRAPFAARPSGPVWFGLMLVTGLALMPAVPSAGADTAPKVAPAPAISDPQALDKKILAEAKNGSEIMANLTYLSDVIGPRLTGSTALKRANE